MTSLFPGSGFLMIGPPVTLEGPGLQGGVYSFRSEQTAGLSILSSRETLLDFSIGLRHGRV